jgi:septum formation protein
MHIGLHIMRLILGSQSPRRKEILNYFALPFVQIPSAFDEDTVEFRGDPGKYAQELSVKKAQELARRFPEDAILTADTVVYLGGKIYNKPKDEHEAFSMLRTFSGNWQQVFTAVTVQKDKAVFSAYEETKILFHPLTDEQIHLYLRSSSFLDKAGGYAIQGTGSILVSRIDGCYYNVMGLPVTLVQQLLLKVGIDLWKHL